MIKKSLCCFYFLPVTTSDSKLVSDEDRNINSTFPTMSACTGPRAVSLVTADAFHCTFADWVPVHDRTTHEHHSIPRHSGRWGVVDVVHLEHDLTVGRHGDTIAVSQGQCLVVVQHRVEILNPDSVYGAIQEQPDIVTLKISKKFHRFFYPLYFQNVCLIRSSNIQDSCHSKYLVGSILFRLRAFHLVRWTCDQAWTGAFNITGL